MTRISKLANRLYKLYNTISPFKICDRLNIHIVELEIPKNVNGFYLNKEGKKIIVLNKNLNDKKKHIVCAHELGHVLLHRNINFYNVRENDISKLSKYEMEADYFCICLLLSEFQNSYKDKICFMSYKDIINITGLPKGLINLWIENNICKVENNFNK